MSALTFSNAKAFGHFIAEEEWQDFRTSSLDGVNPRINFRYDFDHGRIIIREAFAIGAADDDRVSPLWMREEIQIYCSEGGYCLVDFAKDFTANIYAELP
jgi:hypothetical protein